jgi:hypothetical protein
VDLVSWAPGWASSLRQEQTTPHHLRQEETIMPTHRIKRADWDLTVQRLARLGEQVVDQTDDGAEHLIVRTIVVDTNETRPGEWLWLRLGAASVPADARDASRPAPGAVVRFSARDVNATLKCNVDVSHVEMRVEGELSPEQRLDMKTGMFTDVAFERDAADAIAKRLFARYTRL